jgi:hypothetical protein
MLTTLSQKQLRRYQIASEDQNYWLSSIVQSTVNRLDTLLCGTILPDHSAPSDATAL